MDTILPRLVSDGRRDYNVRPPTVGEALVLIHAGPVAVNGDLDSQKIILGTLRDWYPKRLWKKLRRKPVAHLVGSALEIANDALKKSESKKSGKPVDWMRLTAQFMDVYRYRFQEVMSMPWPAFIALSDQMIVVKSLRKLDQIPVAMIPHYADSAARQGAIMSIRADAGLDPISKMSDEDAETGLNTLTAEFAMAGLFTGSA